MLPAPPRIVEPLHSEHLPLEPRGAAVRVAVSPLFTTLASLFEVVGGWRRGADERWVEAVLRRASQVDLTPFALFADEERVVPHLLSPVPVAERPTTFEHELARLRRTPPEAIRDELRTLRPDGRSPALRAWSRDPLRERDAFVAALEAWWRAAILPQWPRMLALLDTEVLRVGRCLATRGVGPTLGGLHPRIGWDGEQLSLLDGARTPSEDPVGDRELVLLPMACGPDGLLTGTDHPDYISIAYAAPGTASLFGPLPGRAADPLAETLGHSRAQVLLSLDQPRPIRALTLAVGLCPSTVHEHLAALQRAELVHRGKVDRDVVYMRTTRGHRLVELF